MPAVVGIIIWKCKASATIAQSMLIFGAVAATTAANVPGMFKAANAWNDISSGLNEATRAMNNANVGKAVNWKARGRSAWNNAKEAYNTEITQAKGFADNIRDTLKTLAGAYLALWATMLALVALALAYLYDVIAPCSPHHSPRRRRWRPKPSASH